MQLIDTLTPFSPRAGTRRLAEQARKRSQAAGGRGGPSRSKGYKVVSGAARPDGSRDLSRPIRTGPDDQALTPGDYEEGLTHPTEPTLDAVQDTAPGSMPRGVPGGSPRAIPAPGALPATGPAEGGDTHTGPQARGTAAGPTTEAVSYTQRRTQYARWAYAELGLNPDQMITRPHEEQIQTMRKALTETFGFTKVTLGPKTDQRALLDSMINAYANVQMMAHAWGLPNEAMSLNKSVALSLEKPNTDYLGKYDLSTLTIHMPTGSNSFAHEWAHALDHYLWKQMMGRPGGVGFAHGADGCAPGAAHAGDLDRGPGALGGCHLGRRCEHRRSGHQRALQVPGPGDTQSAYPGRQSCPG